MTAMTANIIKILEDAGYPKTGDEIKRGIQYLEEDDVRHLAGDDGTMIYLVGYGDQTTEETEKVEVILKRSYPESRLVTDNRRTRNTGRFDAPRVRVFVPNSAIAA